LALETAPALRAVFRLAPRQGEGLIGPIMKAPFSPKIRQLVHPCAAAQTRPLLRRNYSEFRFGRRPARDVHGGNPRGKLDALFSLRECAGVKQRAFLVSVGHGGEVEPLLGASRAARRERSASAHQAKEFLARASVITDDAE
jgi:hypothetical protein